MVVQEVLLYMDSKKFGEFVAETRKELGLTQSELAKKLSVTNKAVSRWETGVYFQKGD